MSRTPRKPIDKVQFFEDHGPGWNTNALALGTTTALVSSLQTKTTAARDAFNAQQVAKMAAETATEAFKQAVAAMNDAGQSIIKQIEAMAQATNNPGVYVLADLPVPPTPTGKGDPGTPFDFKVSIGSLGTLDTKWKNTNATGAVYMIYRRFGGVGDFQLLGGVGKKEFSDDTVPAGTAQVEYRIQAVRSTGESAWAPFTVNLGMEPGMVSVIEGTPTKLAA